MTSYEVRMSDAVVGTGVDCQYFPTREEAQQAADLINSEYQEARAEVSESIEKPTLTFEAWYESPWGSGSDSEPTLEFSGANYSIEYTPDGQYLLVTPAGPDLLYDSLDELIESHPMCQESRAFFYGDE